MFYEMAGGADEMAREVANLVLTKRDLEIIEALSCKVRLLSLEQIGATWWTDNKDPISDASRRMKLLEEAGHIKLHSIMAHPILPFSKPLVAWEPGKEAGDFSKLSYHLANRWPNSHVATTAVSVTRRTANRFGGRGGRTPKRVEMTHDLHVGAVFLIFRESRPDEAKLWISEDVYDANREKRPGDKLPDAVINYGDRQHAIEIGGEYTKEKLEAFHAWCASVGLSYEIW